MTRAWLLAVSLLACGPRTSRPPTEGVVPWARSGIDWRTPPAVDDVAWTAPVVAETLLDNGIRIVVVENHRLPLVAVRVLHTGAGSRMDGTEPGLASLTADVLDEGAGDRSTSRVARELARQGTQLEITIATDHATQQLVTRTRELGPALALVAEMIRRPSFEDADFVRARSSKLTEVLAHRTQTRRIAAHVFDRLVFGAHPYAEPAEGTARSIPALTLEAVRGFWARNYRPDAMTLVIAGDTTMAAVRELVHSKLGDWTAPAPPLPIPATPPPYKAAVAYVDVPGARETNVIVGRRAGALDDPQQLAGEVANAIVGGGLDGRLDRELHTKLALTFGASSSFWRGVAAGSWAAAATFETMNTAAGIDALLGVLATARTSEPTAAEITSARRDLVAAARTSYDTTVGTARAVERLVLQRQPLDSHATLAARLATLTAAQIRDALPLGDLAIVLVGDWTRFRDGLVELGVATPYQP